MLHSGDKFNFIVFSCLVLIFCVNFDFTLAGFQKDLNEPIQRNKHNKFRVCETFNCHFDTKFGYHSRNLQCPSLVNSVNKFDSQLSSDLRIERRSIFDNDYSEIQISPSDGFSKFNQRCGNVDVKRQRRSIEQPANKSDVNLNYQEDYSETKQQSIPTNYSNEDFETALKLSQFYFNNLESQKKKNSPSSKSTAKKIIKGNDTTFEDNQKMNALLRKIGNNREQELNNEKLKNSSLNQNQNAINMNKSTAADDTMHSFGPADRNNGVRVSSYYSLQEHSEFSDRVARKLTQLTFLVVLTIYAMFF